MNDYTDEVYEQKQVCTSTKRLFIILDDKYEKVDSNKLTENQCKHLTEVQHN